MLQPYTNFRQLRWQRKPLRPFKNDHGRLGEQVLHAQRFEIMKALDAVQVTVKNRLPFAVSVYKGERRTGYVFFAGRTERAYDTFRQRRFPTTEGTGKKYQGRRYY